MNLVEIAAKLVLHPRAIVMLGTCDIRMKNSGSLPGLTPHYAMQGCPVVQYNGANAVEDPAPANIEFAFQETSFPLPSALQGYNAKQGNVVQLLFGRNGQAPTQPAYRLLREASAKVNAVAASKRQVFLVSLPILTPGQMGITTGRHYLLGLFEVDGTPIYLHPDAVAQGVFKAEYPADQRERSTAAQPAAPVVASWYEPMAAALSSVGLRGKELHETILKGRAQQLVDQGVAPSLEAGLALARQDAPAQSEAAPNGTPAKAARPAAAASAGKKLLKGK